MVAAVLRKLFERLSMYHFGGELAADTTVQGYHSGTSLINGITGKVRGKDLGKKSDCRNA